MENLTLDARELAELIKCSHRNVINNQSRAPHLLPPFRRVGRKAVWVKSVVLDWLSRTETAQKEEKGTPKPSPGRPRKQQKNGGAK
jgi:hypothetical protein